MAKALQAIAVPFAINCYDDAFRLSGLALQSMMPTSTPNTALLLFAHGSAEPAWAEPFRKLQTMLRAREPGRRVELAFLERMSPSFDDAVAGLHAAGVAHITVAPIFLAIGGHMRRDLPALVDAAQLRTGITFRVLPALGEADTLLESIADWVVAN